MIVVVRCMLYLYAVCVMILYPQLLIYSLVSFSLETFSKLMLIEVFITLLSLMYLVYFLDHRSWADCFLNYVLVSIKECHDLFAERTDMLQFEDSNCISVIIL